MRRPAKVDIEEAVKACTVLKRCRFFSQLTRDLKHLQRGQQSLRQFYDELIQISNNIRSWDNNS